MAASGQTSCASPSRVALTSILEQLSSLIGTVMIGRLMGPEGTIGMAAIGANTQGMAGLIIVLFVGV